MKQSEFRKLIREEIKKVLSEAQPNSADVEKKVVAAFKKMGLTVKKIDSNLSGLSSPNIEVWFKDLSYGGGDEYDIMNDYNDEYRDEDGIEFTDVSTDARDKNKLYFYISK